MRAKRRSWERVVYVSRATQRRVSKRRAFDELFFEKPCLGQVRAIKALLSREEVDVVFWMDADAVAVNHKLDLLQLAVRCPYQPYDGHRVG